MCLLRIRDAAFLLRIILRNNEVAFGLGDIDMPLSTMLHLRTEVLPREVEEILRTDAEVVVSSGEGTV